MKNHLYHTTVQWTGNEGKGTTDPKSYNRNYDILCPGKHSPIKGSSDAAFSGDGKRYNPEDLLVSSISACHMLWYLHLCAINKIVVTEYSDEAVGLMEETANGSGQFKEVTLNPIIKITDSKLIEKASQLHIEAHKMCFIANSCNFKINHKPQISAE
ncbi:peroxiredoxin [Arenibacter sp. N53]|uniref:OsmC family protein n=1 Tax=Arenibacter TaxID=178469 RepID=UPI000CD3FAEB|nr:MULTISPECIES: OsmC family protein [Arenibacter]MCM4152562.1 peroxiredoxin [Arenibacter sp. N53]